MPARDERQKIVATFVVRNWGEACLTDRDERAMRVLEEAIELAQAEGIELGRVEHLARHVYSKPPGRPAQEVGGIGVTLLAFCHAADLSADAEEQAEIRRILAIPAEHFRERHRIKSDAGIARAAEPNGSA